jgi:GntR family transcriptional regulator, rspAB operon transcriptional repressor
MHATDTIERPQSLTSMVIGRLRDAIIDGTIELGSLLSEKQLAESYGTSKTPVREAIVYLQSLGLVEVLPQKGGIVFRPTVEQVRELCEVRLELEIIAFKFSMERNRVAFSEHLSSTVRKMIELYDVGQPQLYQRLDNEFHYSFFIHCGNSLLTKTYDLFSPRICALRTHLSTPQPYLLNRSFEEHKMLLEFVNGNDIDSAVLMLKEHINRTRECHSRVLSFTSVMEPGGFRHKRATRFLA